MRILVVALAALALAACSRSEFDQLRKDFLAGCTSTGVPDDQCECSFNKLKEKYPPEVMVAINRRGIPPEGFTDDAMQAQLLCVAGSPKSLRDVEREAEVKALAAKAAANPAMDVSEMNVPAPAPADPEAEIKAKYEAEWGQPMPEETLEDIQGRYEATDSILNMRYKDAMARLEPASQQQLRERQRAWLRERDQACGTKDGQSAEKAGLTCLIDETDKRIKVIENWH